MYLACSYKNTSFKAIRNGGISITSEIDGKIASYIKELRACSLPVNTKDIILYAKELFEPFRDRTIKSLRNWAYRFIKRMGFGFRVITKAKTKTKDNINEYIKKFYIITRKIIEEKNLLNSKENIIN